MSDVAADFGNLIAERIRAEHVSISSRWLEPLHQLLPVEITEIFPSEELLDHVPALIKEVAAHVESPDAEAVAANTAIIAKAQELGELRHAQRASLHQLLTEYRLLGSILAAFVQEELASLGPGPTASDAIGVLRRRHEALWILMQATVNTFIAEYTETIATHTTLV